jgi:hypothetical protein
MKSYSKEEIGAVIRLKFNDSDASYIANYVSTVKDFFGDNGKVESALTLWTNRRANDREINEIRKGMEEVCETVHHPLSLIFFGFRIFGNTVGWEIEETCRKKSVLVVRDNLMSRIGGESLDATAELYIPLVSTDSKRFRSTVMKEIGELKREWREKKIDSKRRKQLELATMFALNKADPGWKYGGGCSPYFTTWGSRVNLCFNGENVCDYDLSEHKSLTPEESRQLPMPPTPHLQHYRDFAAYAELYDRDKGWHTADRSGELLIWYGSYWATKYKKYYDPPFAEWFRHKYGGKIPPPEY